MLDRRGRRGVEPFARIDRADLDRARAGQRAAKALVDMRAFARADRRFAFQFLGRGNVGHPILVVEAALGHLERRRHVEDRRAALHRDDAAGGEAATLEIAHDAEDDRIILVAGAHEIGVERMRDFGRIGRALRGLQRLRDHLPAEHPADTVALAPAAIQIGVDFLHVEQVDQFGGELGRGRNGGI